MQSILLEVLISSYHRVLPALSYHEAELIQMGSSTQERLKAPLQTEAPLFIATHLQCLLALPDLCEVR